MTVVTIHYAKTNLSRLLAEVEAGGEVVIARGKTPVARIVPEPAEAPKPKRQAGMWKGRVGFGFSDSFFDPLPDYDLALWNGEGD
ncbi:MAG: type II toxin-antitoxin system prevent-host-death family antitoxin [Caulobacter sp.]|nr:type II toxin-antitoxin system prevent-host-death family antitoxin [Caulobacter sp.]